MFGYLKSFLDKTDPTTSLKHAAYALVVVMSCAWLSYHLIKVGMDATWMGVYTVLVGAVTTTKLVGGKDEASGVVPKP